MTFLCNSSCRLSLLACDAFLKFFCHLCHLCASDASDASGSSGRSAQRWPCWFCPRPLKKLLQKCCVFLCERLRYPNDDCRENKNIIHQGPYPRVYHLAKFQHPYREGHGHFSICFLNKKRDREAHRHIDVQLPSVAYRGDEHQTWSLDKASQVIRTAAVCFLLQDSQAEFCTGQLQCQVVANRRHGIT